MPEEVEEGTRLSDMEYDEVSLVTRGANQRAKVVLWKSDTNEEDDIDKKKACDYDHRGLTKNARCPECGMRSTGAYGRMRKLFDALRSAGLDERDARMVAKAIPTQDGVGGTLPSANGNEDGSDGGNMPTTQEEVNIDLSKLSPEVAEQVRKLQESNAELLDDNRSLAKALSNVVKDEDDDDDEPDDDADDEEDSEADDFDHTGEGEGGRTTEEGAKPDLVTRIEEMGDDETIQDQLNKLAKSDPASARLFKSLFDENRRNRKVVKTAIEKAETERGLRLDREWISKVDAEYPNLNINAPEFGPIMRQIAETMPSVVGKLEKVLKSANAIAEAGGVFTEHGRSGNAVVKGHDAIEKVTSMAEELRKSDDKLTIEQAKARVLMDNPDLYMEYRAEKEGK